MGKGGQSDGEMLKGTLDMMILRTLITGDAHDGGAIATGVGAGEQIVFPSKSDSTDILPISVKN